MVSKVHCVVGGQFGSEAKGAVAAFLSTQIKGKVVGVRVGGPNAGHTVYGKCPIGCTEHLVDDRVTPVEDRHPWRLRQVPVLAVSRQDALLIIAQGSEIDIQVLLDEVDALDAAGYKVSNRIVVDRNATVITSDHKYREQAGKLNDRLGSTAKGIGAARADRIMRTAPRAIDWVYDKNEEGDFSLTHIPIESVQDTSDHLRASTAADATIIIEGTQGYGLGLHTSYYPFTTSGDCRSIDLLQQTGLNPFGQDKLDVHTWVVVRPYPIRVAGNSGPLKDETTWEELGLPQELTTVTQKVRRVGKWDPDLVNRAIDANGGPCDRLHLVLTMVDQLVPGCAGKTTIEEMGGDVVGRVRLAVGEFEATVSAPIELIGTGPNSMTWYRGNGPKSVRNDPFAGIRRAAEQAVRMFGSSGPAFEAIEVATEPSDELTDWWMNRAQAEVKPMVDKALEYGGKGAAIDLIEIGRDLARISGKSDVTDYEATELGIYFYLRGKFGRWQAAVLEGREVSDDTLHDIGVYVRMAQRNRDVGGWPYAPEEYR